MLVTLLPAATFAGSTAPDAVKSAEWRVLSQMNQVRRNQGLHPLLMAGRVRVVARDRSRSMRAGSYFSHVSPSGQTAGSMLAGRDISHAFWGEAIGWTQYMNLHEGAKWMVDWWKNSPTHRRLMLRRDFNYAGIGIARDGHRTLWTIVFVNQPDHTPPIAGLIGPASRTVATATNQVTVRWWGRDRILSTRTAGLQSFSIQRKTPRGLWIPVLRNTTRRSVTVNLGSGEHYFRLRATDRRGNQGNWRPPLKVVVS
jgi:hypothetical protein